MKTQPKLSHKILEKFLLGIFYGLGQALGVTLIFALLITYLSRLLTALGGLPFLGSLLTKIVQNSQTTLNPIN